MHTITFLTGNAGKFREAQAIIPSLVQRDIDLAELQSLDPREVITAKLEEARRQGVRGDIVVEDVSLYLDALGGFPGPLIKWFLACLKAEGIAELVQTLGKGNAARAQCLVGYLANGAHEPQFFESTLYGTIVAPRGAGGFGWDAIFQPDAGDRTLGELTLEEKNALSMRAQACGSLAKACL